MTADCENYRLGLELKSSVRVSGKFFIVGDPLHNKSYTLNNKLSAEQLSDSLNKLYSEINHQSILIKEYQERNELLSHENQQLKYRVKEAYNTERTMLGKSVLRQLLESLGGDVV